MAEATLGNATHFALYVALHLRFEVAGTMQECRKRRRHTTFPLCIYFLCSFRPKRQKSSSRGQGYSSFVLSLATADKSWNVTSEPTTTLALDCNGNMDERFIFFNVILYICSFLLLLHFLTFIFIVTLLFRVPSLSTKCTRRGPLPKTDVSGPETKSSM